MEGDVRLEKGIPARLTAAEGRKFGLLVGGAFLLFGAISRWRGHDVAPLVMWALGGSLTLGGLLLPAQLGPIYRAWMGLAHALSKITTPIFMGLVYFLVLTPTGFLMRLFGKHPLKHREHGGGYWARREPNDGADTMSRQF
jgi:hypothetical protein